MGERWASRDGNPKVFTDGLSAEADEGGQENENKRGGGNTSVLGKGSRSLFSAVLPRSPGFILRSM